MSSFYSVPTLSEDMHMLEHMYTSEAHKNYSRVSELVTSQEKELQRITGTVYQCIPKGTIQVTTLA